MASFIVCTTLSAGPLDSDPYWGDSSCLHIWYSSQLCVILPFVNSLALSETNEYCTPNRAGTKDIQKQFQLGDHHRRRLRSIQIKHRLKWERCQNAVYGLSPCVVVPTVQLRAVFWWIYHYEVEVRYFGASIHVALSFAAHFPPPRCELQHSSHWIIPAWVSWSISKTRCSLGGLNGLVPLFTK